MTGFTSLKYASRCFVSPNDLEFAGSDPDIERASGSMLGRNYGPGQAPVVCHKGSLLRPGVDIFPHSLESCTNSSSGEALHCPKHFSDRRKYWMCDIKLYH